MPRGSMRKMAKEMGLKPKEDECVRVFVRVRPLSNKEKGNGNRKVVFCDADSGSVEVVDANDDRADPKMFTFDGTFEKDVTQEHVYNVAASSIVEGVLEGYNGTIFCYGQTGAGKTHTMEGYSDPPELKGIIPNSFAHIFDAIKSAAEGTRYLVRASFLEIYNEEIRDLLSTEYKKKLEIRENVNSGVYVDGLTMRVVKSVAQIDEVQKDGKKNRSTGATAMNQTSSRSHSIFTIVVESSDTGPDGESRIKVGKLNLVDLAGSERQSKTQAEGDRLKEAININKSLSALGNVISALVDNKSSHIPYRDSKLTRLLEDSLGGNTKTVMIANCGPADYNYEETISTLRYANRAKQIKNKPKINEDPKDAMLRQFQDEIMRLRKQLEEGGGGEGYDDGMPGSKDDDGDFASGDGETKRVVKEVVKIEHTGISEEEFEKLREETERRKQELLRQAEEESHEAKQREELSREERRQLKEKLRQEREIKLRESEKLEDAAKRLEEMQTKLIFHERIQAKAERQRAKLRRAQIQLQERERQERILRQEVERQEKTNIHLEQKFTSLEDEVEVKTMKLKKLFKRYQEIRNEIKDVKAQNQREREELWEMRRELQRQIQLKQSIIDNFVPSSQSSRFEINRNVIWDDEIDQWNMVSQEERIQSLLPPRPVSKKGDRRPVSDYARERAKLDKNPRYRTENVVEIPLYTHKRTTSDFEPDMSSRVQEALDLALGGDEDDEISIQSSSALRSVRGGYGEEKY